MQNTTRSRLVLISAAAIYLSLALSGIRFGLPDSFHILSYNCDETGWLEGLSNLTPARGYNPHPEQKQPLFFQECYAAVVGAGAMASWIPIHESKEFFRNHPEIFSRLYLAGRGLVVGFGILLLFSVWLSARTFFGAEAGDAAVLLVSVTPALTAASHFLQSNITVATLVFIALACFLQDERASDRPFRWLLAGCFVSGLAMATKYSALPLAIVCLFQSLRHSPRARRFVAAGLLLGAGFLLGEPFALLHPQSFLESFRAISGNVLLEVSGTLWYKTIFPFFYPIRFSFGTPLWAAAVISTAIAMRHNLRRVPFFFLWLFLTLAGIMASGRVASSGRVFLLVPPLIVILAAYLAWGYRQGGWRRTASVAAFVFLFSSTLVYALSIAVLHRSLPIQKQSSQWIEEHIPREAKIGVPRKPFYWTPDIILDSYFWPQRTARPYAITNLDFSIAEGRRMDYILVATQEWKSEEGEPGGPAFFAWLNKGDEFQLVHTFPRHVAFGPFQWSRPEFPFVFDDDLWSYSFYIYQRKSS